MVHGQSCQSYSFMGGLVLICDLAPIYVFVHDHVLVCDFSHVCILFMLLFTLWLFFAFLFVLFTFLFMTLLLFVIFQDNFAPICSLLLCKVEHQGAKNICEGNACFHHLLLSELAFFRFLVVVSCVGFHFHLCCLWSSNTFIIITIQCCFALKFVVSLCVSVATKNKGRN